MKMFEETHSVEDKDLGVRITLKTPTWWGLFTMSLFTSGVTFFSVRLLAWLLQ